MKHIIDKKKRHCRVRQHITLRVCPYVRISLSHTYTNALSGTPFLSFLFFSDIKLHTMGLIREKSCQLRSSETKNHFVLSPPSLLFSFILSFHLLLLPFRLQCPLLLYCLIPSFFQSLFLSDSYFFLRTS